MYVGSREDHHRSEPIPQENSASTAPSHKNKGTKSNDTSFTLMHPAFQPPKRDTNSTPTNSVLPTPPPSRHYSQPNDHSPLQPHHYTLDPHKTDKANSITTYNEASLSGDSNSEEIDLTSSGTCLDYSNNNKC